jgi:MATE family multidrug resistance protein
VRILGRHPDDKLIAALAVPALGALAADPLYSLVDTALVGHLGKEPLGAVAVGIAAFTASFWIFSFLAYGLTPRVALAFGAGDRQRATDLGVQAILVGSAIGVVIAVLGYLLAPGIVHLLGAGPDIDHLATSYLRIRILAAPMVLIALAGHGWFRGARDTKTPMLIAVAGAIANAFLAYLLIYPLKMGVQGAAWATLVCQSAVALAFLFMLAKRFNRPRWRPDFQVIGSFMGVGADLIVRTGSLLVATTLSTSIAARIGTKELATWQIVMQLFYLLALLMDSLAIAAQALVARQIGARDEVAARRMGNRLMELGFLFGLLLAMVLYALKSPIAGLFTSDASVIQGSERFIGWLALTQPLCALAFTLDGIMVGALKTRFLAAATLVSSALFVGVGFTAYNLELGLAGLALAGGLWLFLRTVTSATYYLRGNWAQIT